MQRLTRQGRSGRCDDDHRSTRWGHNPSSWWRRGSNTWRRTAASAAAHCVNHRAKQNCGQSTAPRQAAPRLERAFKQPAILAHPDQKQTERQQNEQANPSGRNRAPDSRGRQQSISAARRDHNCQCCRSAIRNRHACGNLARCARRCAATSQSHAPSITRSRRQLQLKLRGLARRDSGRRRTARSGGHRKRRIGGGRQGNRLRRVWRVVRERQIRCARAGTKGTEDERDSAVCRRGNGILAIVSQREIGRVRACQGNRRDVKDSRPRVCDCQRLSCT